MRVTKDWIQNFDSRVDPTILASEENTAPVNEFVNRFLKQTKQVSQVIARSWISDESGQALRQYFLKPYDDETSDGNLKRLLGADPNDSSDYQQELNLLREFCKDSELPIFSKYELEKVYTFAVKVNIFEGSFDEIPGTRQRESPYFEVIVPYPPQPSELNVTQSELYKWTQEDVMRGGNVVHPINPPSPYIPASCC